MSYFRAYEIISTGILSRAEYLVPFKHPKFAWISKMAIWRFDSQVLNFPICLFTNSDAKFEFYFKLYSQYTPPKTQVLNRQFRGCSASSLIAVHTCYNVCSNEKHIN